jgi:hypothetical protein
MQATLTSAEWYQCYRLSNAIGDWLGAYLLQSDRAYRSETETDPHAADISWNGGAPLMVDPYAPGCDVPLAWFRYISSPGTNDTTGYAAAWHCEPTTPRVYTPGPMTVGERGAW